MKIVYPLLDKYDTRSCMQENPAALALRGIHQLAQEIGELDNMFTPVGLLSTLGSKMKVDRAITETCIANARPVLEQRFPDSICKFDRLDVAVHAYLSGDYDSACRALEKK